MGVCGLRVNCAGTGSRWTGQLGWAVGGLLGAVSLRRVLLPDVGEGGLTRRLTKRGLRGNNHAPAEVHDLAAMRVFLGAVSD